MTKKAQGQEPNKIFSWEEIEKHNCVSSLWVVHNDKVYDVTKFLHKHPGGEFMLLMGSGRDASHLIDSYHPLYVPEKMLAKYLIGYTASPHPVTPHYPKKSKFYSTLKSRVEAKLKEKSLRPRDRPEMYVRWIFLFAIYAYIAYNALYVKKDNLTSVILWGMLQGYFVQLFANTLDHDAWHGGISKKPWVGAVLGYSLDLVGLGHHLYTNVKGQDPDIRTRKIGRMVPSQVRKPFHVFQHVFLPLVFYPIVVFKWVISDFINFYITGYVGPVKLPQPRPIDHFLFLFGKTVFATYTFLIPHFYFGIQWKMVFLTYLFQMLTCSLILTFEFVVAHVVDAASFPTVNKDNAIEMDEWATLQVKTTTNFCVDNWLITLLSGGLNHQIEHHLFPSIAQSLYPTIAPIVRQTCKDFGIHYQAYNTFSEAFSAHLRLLKVLGSQDEFTSPY